MVYTQAAYCRCGAEIWVEYLWNGKEWVARFSTPELEEVDVCPNCGAELHAEELESI